jgi:hypothetical protein
MIMVSVRRAGISLLVAAAAVVAPPLFSPSAHGDCCLQPPNRAPAPFHIRFHEPVPLAAVLSGQVSSEGSADYRAQVQVLVRRKVVVGLTVRGHSTKAWSPLHIRLSTAQRQRVRVAAGSARRAILAVRLSGRLPGHVHASAHLRNFLMHF